MAYERLGESPIDYYQCRYGKSKLMFRGPKKDLRKGYFAFIGGTETFGKYVKHPFPDLLESSLEWPCVNLGAVNAGVDAFVNDPAIIDICGGSKGTVVQVMGAQNMSNRLYSVHPRRNDRFLKSSSLLETLYREVDFTEYSFTRHLLSSLKELSPEKFTVVEEELKEAWVARMSAMLRKITGRTILLWISDRQPDSLEQSEDAPLGLDPLFVGREMIERIRPLVTDVVEVQVPRSYANKGVEGMFFPPMELGAAEELYGPDVHQHIADHLRSAF
ncbi:MAG: DUF6473 family protein [Pseudomonadota bacterium]